MRLIGNLLWFIFTGLVSAISWSVIGLLWCVTIVGIPFGRQCFKLAGVAIWPMGKEVSTDFEAHPIANVLWLVFGGLGVVVGYLLTGLIWCITIIGIPFGKQCFKLARVAMAPFGVYIF